MSPAASGATRRFAIAPAWSAGASAHDQNNFTFQQLLHNRFPFFWRSIEFFGSNPIDFKETSFDQLLLESISSTENCVLPFP